MKKQIWKRVVIIFVSLFVTYWLLQTVLPPAILYGSVHRRYDFNDTATPWEERTFPDGLTADKVILDTEDGERVAMYTLLPEKPKAVILYLTGISGPTVQSFANQAIELSKQNIGALFLEMRAHGESSGQLIGLGFLEGRDVKAAVSYAEETLLIGDTPLILQGVSMGGATALIAGAENEAVDGIIAMSPFVTYGEQFDLAMKSYFVPPLSRRYVSLLIEKTLKLMYGNEVTDRENPRAKTEALREMPILLMASKDDRTVSSENTQILSTLLPNASVWVRDGKNHLIVDGNELENAASDEAYMTTLNRWLGDLIE